MLKLQKSEGGTAYYVADGPLTHRDVATLRKHPWISLMSGQCRMWWQGEGDGLFLFNNSGQGGDKRVPYDIADPDAIHELNTAWNEYSKAAR
jgi:hypothetical protein